MSSRGEMAAIVLTFDVDWAPDFVIDWLSSYLVERELPATWFITHMSPAVRRLGEHPALFELGIHPNFIQPSTHGADVREVIGHCLGLVPDAFSMRTHSLYQSTRLFTEILERTDVRVDASLFLPGTSTIEPVDFTWNGKTLLRIPFFWEDDLAMRAGQRRWDATELQLPTGPRVLDFHPIHLFLNSASMDAYEELKRRAPNLISCAPDDVRPHVNPGDGVMTLFTTLTERIAAGAAAATLRDVYDARKLDHAAGGATR